jgi:L-aspartate oxidase
MIATHTLLATGGIGSVYGSTTNDLSATGDGIGMASRQNIPIKDMEFIQFHPTAFHDDTNKTRKKFLITEALRGEGAHLINIDHERFMDKYDRERMELAPRDVVSQAIFREMYDTWTDHVYLDTRHLDASHVQKRFPGIDKHLRKHDIILGKDLIPVSPCEHFLCGGIATDLHGKTSITGLYAVGETAYTGVHGANRLASNSLLECLVFGDEIAKVINDSQLDDVKHHVNHTLANTRAHNFNYKPIRKKIGDLMDEHVGIVRTRKGLSQTLDILREIKSNLMKEPNLTRPYYETLNMVTTAMIINEQALERKESIGCHLRID